MASWVITGVGQLLQLKPILLLYASFFTRSGVAMCPVSMSVGDRKRKDIHMVSGAGRIRCVGTAMFHVSGPSAPRRGRVRMASNSTGRLIVVPPGFTLPNNDDGAIHFITVRPRRGRGGCQIGFRTMPDVSSTASGGGSLSVRLAIGLV